jgi:hypothetical protein
MLLKDEDKKSRISCMLRLFRGSKYKNNYLPLGHIVGGVGEGGGGKGRREMNIYKNPAHFLNDGTGSSLQSPD